MTDVRTQGEQARETDCTDHPVCPHCGHIHQDDWEWSRSFDSGAIQNCDSCGKEFFAMREVSISWSTEPVEEPDRGFEAAV